MILDLNVERAKYKNVTRRLGLMVLIRLLGFCLVLSGNALGQEKLDYQKRANRYEGIKPKPVSGFDIELLSARIDHHDDTGGVGERFQVRFFLDQARPVHLLVREVDYKHYYWMDRVEPSSPWQAGFSNVFDWPTADVIRQLNGLSLYDLGVVARLDNPSPRAEERVAPALLFQAKQPVKVNGYIFVFRLREEAKIKGAVYKASGGAPVLVQDLGQQRGGRPFEFRWDFSRASAPQGAYKLVLSGYVLSNNDPVTQVVHFYHQPVIE